MLIIKCKNFLDFHLEGAGNIVRQFQGRIVFSLFKKYDRFSPYTYSYSQLVLCQSEPGTQFLDPVIH